VLCCQSRDIARFIFRLGMVFIAEVTEVDGAFSAKLSIYTPKDFFSLLFITNCLYSILLLFFYLVIRSNSILSPLA